MKVSSMTNFVHNKRLFFRMCLQEFWQGWLDCKSFYKKFQEFSSTLVKIMSILVSFFQKAQLLKKHDFQNKS